MTLRPYPEYRDSGLPWLGEIPAHWKKLAIKRLLSKMDYGTSANLGGVGNVRVLTMGHIQNGEIILPEVGNLDDVSPDLLLKTNDLLFNRTNSPELVGKVGIFRGTSEGKVSFASYLVRLRSETEHYPAYLNYLLNCAPFLRFARSQALVSLHQANLSSSRYSRIPVVIPPREEQEKIVAYLSARDRQIARLIRAKQRLIELLTEQKQAIIHRAATRGLDPDAKMKQTGLDWLPEVPEHWEVKPLKYLVENVNNQTATRSDDEIYVALENIESWTGRITILDEPPEFDSQVKRFQPGDVLFGKLRPYLAKVARPPRSGVCVGELLVLRCRDSSILPEYLEVRLRSRQVIDLINSSTFGAKMPRADWGFIGSIALAFPKSRTEQKELLSFIAGETRTIDKAIERARREIDLIREYRTRLVSDVVTGRLDVRGTKPPKVEDIEDPPGLEESLPPMLDDLVGESRTAP